MSGCYPAWAICLGSHVLSLLLPAAQELSLTTPGGTQQAPQTANNAAEG